MLIRWSMQQWTVQFYDHKIISDMYIYVYRIPLSFVDWNHYELMICDSVQGWLDPCCKWNLFQSLLHQYCRVCIPQSSDRTNVVHLFVIIIIGTFFLTIFIFTFITVATLSHHYHYHHFGNHFYFLFPTYLRIWMCVSLSTWIIAAVNDCFSRVQGYPQWLWTTNWAGAHCHHCRISLSSFFIQSFQPFSTNVVKTRVNHPPNHQKSYKHV